MGTGVVMLTALLVSLSSIFSRFAYDAGANPQTLVFFRFLLFSSLYLVIAGIVSKPLHLPRQNRFFVYLAGGFYTLGSGALLASMFYLPVSLAIVIFYTYPIFTLAGEKFAAGERLKPIETGCFVLAFTGLLLALKIDFLTLNATGVGLATIASLAMSASYLTSEKKLKSVKPFLLTFHLALCGLVIMTLYILLTGSFNPGKFTSTALLSVFLASLCFSAAFFCMFKGISLIGAVNTAMILNLEPVFTIGLAFLLLNESLAAIQIFGAVLVIISIITVQRYRYYS